MVQSNEFKGADLAEAVRNATAAYGKPGRQETKSTQQVWAPPLFWGPWVDIHTQFGVVGTESERHVTRLDVSFDTRSQAPSTFDVEIKGGDDFVRAIGPGSAEVTITGNVATTIRLRAKSHSTGQNVFADVR